jgi:hypothetical protein
MSTYQSPLHIVLRVELPANPAQSSSLWLPRLLCALSLLRDRQWLARRLSLPFVFPESWTVVYAQHHEHSDNSLLLHATLMSATYGLLTTADNNVDVYFERFWDIEAALEDKHLSIFTLHLAHLEDSETQMGAESTNEKLGLPEKWLAIKNAKIVQTIDVAKDVLEQM